MPRAELGVIGLGRMGGGLARLALEKNLRVAGFTLGRIPDELITAGLQHITDIAGFRNHLVPPRILLLYIPAGPEVDKTLDQLSGILEPGDIIVDGGNSYWGDSIQRHARLKTQGFDFVDLGTSGGVPGALTGACFMAGGETHVVKAVEPIFRTLAVSNGFVHAGPPGAEHFVKLVHNGIEFGMLQAVAEGYQLLLHYHKRLEISSVLECWRHGSVIRSWLVDLLAQACRQDPTLGKASTYIEDTGEVNWLISDALRMEVPIPVIAQSVMELFASRDGKHDWAKAIVAMRHGFGGHPMGRDEAVARERRQGRVGDIFQPAAGGKD